MSKTETKMGEAELMVRGGGVTLTLRNFRHLASKGPDVDISKPGAGAKSWRAAPSPSRSTPASATPARCSHHLGR